MAGTITHQWYGTTLAITSDSGTSMCDLKGEQGDMGIRGPQGCPGVIRSEDGTIDFTAYATAEYVDEQIAAATADVDVDLSDYYTKAETGTVISEVITGYATENYVQAKIAAAQLEGAGVDMTPYATTEYVDAALENAGGGVGEAGTKTGAEIFNSYDGTYANVASGVYSHAEGWNATASGSYAHAEGSSTEASGTKSHAEGNSTTASGESSHAEGRYNEASGIASHAEGTSCEAYGKASHAEGGDTIARGDYQHVQGTGNIEDTEGRYAHIVGNADISGPFDRSNCHTLDWDGNAWFAGKVYVGGTSMDDATELGAGGGDVDLTNYYTKTEVDSMIGDYYTKTEVDSIVGNLASYSLTDEDKQEIAQLTLALIPSAEEEEY